MNDEKFYTARGYQLLDKNKNVLTPSLEDYLEMICRAIRDNGHIRVNELAADLNVRPSSVSKTLAKLSKAGLVDYEKYGIIKLTEEGEKAGAYLLHRHDVMKHFFEMISHESPNDIFAETEMVEHMVSKNTVSSIEHLLRFFHANPEIYQRFKNYKVKRQKVK